jgi:membrane protease YdiL (CAAX protease family)
MPVLIRLLRRSPLLWYFLFAYAASAVALAVIGLPKLDGSGGRPAASLVMLPVTVIGAGLAGLAMTAATNGKEGLRQLRERLTRWRLGRWWLVLPLPPLGILAVLTAFRLLVSPSFAPQFLAFGIGIGLVAGCFEEIGWTGFAYPRLRARFGGLGGALLLGLLWAFWHVPVVDSLGAASPHGAAWPAFFASFATLVMAMRVLIAWLYVNTDSVLGTQLLHASSTGFLVVLSAPDVSPNQEALWYLAYAAVLWIAVGLVVAACGPSLRTARRQLAGQRTGGPDPFDAAAVA